MKSKRDTPGKRSGMRLALPVAAALLIGSVSAPLVGPLKIAEAQNIMEHAHQLKRKTMNINVNGKTISAPAGTLYNTTYVGLRFLSSHLGMTTKWDPKTRRISVSSKNKTMEMMAGSDEFSLNGHTFSDAAISPIIVDGTTYLPLRFLLEQMGFTIRYKGATKLITITQIKENDVKLMNKKLEQSPDILVQYPQLDGVASKAAQVKINAVLETDARKFFDYSKNLNEKILFYTSTYEEETPYVSFNFDYKITYNVNNKLSLYFNMYEYTGGAHGIYDYIGHTFDLTTGEELTLQKAVGGNPDYIEIINEEIKKQIKAKDIPLIEPFETISEDQRFYLSGDSIIVYFSLYEYTSYADGIPEFEIPLSKFGLS